MPDLVKFFYLTNDKYVALDPKDESALYFVTDTQQIFKGSTQYSYPVKVVENLPVGLDQFVTGVIYVATATNDVVMSDGQKIITLFSASSAAVAISKDGTAVVQKANNFNFVGELVSITTDEDNPNTANIQFNLNYKSQCPSNYNRSTPGNTDATVPNFTQYSQRYVSLPSADAYYVGDWSTVAKRNVLNNDVTELVYSSPSDGYFWIPNTNTFFRISIIQNDTVFTKDLPVITGNGTFGTYATDNCQVVISGYSESLVGYKGLAQVKINIGAILTNGGRFSVKIEHVDSGTTYAKTQNDFFFDSDKSSGSIGSVEIAEKTLTSKWLSGTEYIGAGSTFTITANNMTGLFNESFADNVMSMESNAQLGISSFNVAASSITTIASVTNDATVATYSVDKTVAASKYVNGTVTASATPSNGWTTGTKVTSTALTLSKPLDTYAAASTSLADQFQDENYRLNNTDWTKWNSQTALSAGNLRVGKGTWLYRESSDSTSQVYYRNFAPSNNATNATSNFIFTLAGTGLTEANLTAKKFDLEISLNGTDWFTFSKLQEVPMVNGSGVRVQADTYKLSGTSGKLMGSFAAGTYTTATSGKGGNITAYGIYARITITDASIELNSISVEMS